PDLTAHALRALAGCSRRWYGKLPTHKDDAPHNKREVLLNVVYGVLALSIPEGLRYLSESQRPDGSWLPLWFGNQHAPDDSNPTYGTARVLAAYRDLDRMNDEPARRGVRWLLAVQ